MSQVITELPPELQGDRALVLEAVTKNWKATRGCAWDGYSMASMAFYHGSMQKLPTSGRCV